MESAPQNLHSKDNIAPHLAGARANIETRLSAIIPPAEAWPRLLHAAQRHALLSPGKRFRPLLCVFISQGAGFAGDAAVDVGCVAEMVHAASLILDDLPCMDDAELRRNQPTTHIAFDESTAILTATALLNRAFGVLAQLPDISAEARIELVELLSYAVGSKGLIAGQIADLANTDKGASIAEIERLNTLKTGALFDFAIEGAAIISGLSAPRRAALKDFSHHLGLAFQLMDDVKDTIMSDGQAEKSTGRDIGKATILALAGSDAAKGRLTGYILSAKDALARAKLDNSVVLDAVIDTQFSFLN
ncbi:MAG: polyprenyl synthetase family protein [Maricaulaceae bacterium]